MQEALLSPYGLKFAQGIIHMISNCLSTKGKTLGEFKEDTVFSEDAGLKW